MSDPMLKAWIQDTHLDKLDGYPPGMPRPHTRSPATSHTEGTPIMQGLTRGR